MVSTAGNGGTGRMQERKPNRLCDYDYSQAGYYFVTACIYEHCEWFGEIKNKEMLLNKRGKIAEKTWLQIPRHFKNIELDEYVIMPNHMHGIIIINDDNNDDGQRVCGNNQRVGTWHALSLHAGSHDGSHAGSHDGSHAGSHDGLRDAKRQHQKLPVIIGSYKSTVTKCINILGDKIYFRWQRSFYDTVIRDDISLNKIREYITANPAMWDSDEENVNGADFPQYRKVAKIF